MVEDNVVRTFIIGAVILGLLVACGVIGFTTMFWHVSWLGWAAGLFLGAVSIPLTVFVMSRLS